MNKTKKLIAIALSMGLVFTSGMAAFANVTEVAQGDGIEKNSTVCTLAEHEHGEGCYENGVLTCTLKEHTHDALCNLNTVQGEQQGQPEQENPEMDAENSNQNQTQNLSSDGDGTGDEANPSENEPAEDHTVYVSAEQAADNEAVKGSKENPYVSLAEAVNAVNSRSEKEAIIEILSNLTAASCARINGKDVTVKGNGHTITRGDNFATISDNARSLYNPAMIEVCNSADRPNSASLRLENITLTDGGKTAGTKYSQATTDGKGGNGDTVQDAIIATYDGVGTITLGQNVTLDGYGGMSAVRLSGGKLVMESGSMISGGKTFTTKGGGNGAAGAVWIQGGNLVMNEGAEITNIVGRAVYLDGAGSYALINGTVSGVTPNANMWQGTDGTAMHVRNESKVTLGETGRIQNIRGGDAVITVISSSFEAKKGSVMTDSHDTRLMNVWYAKTEDTRPHLVYLDGIISDCEYKDIMFNTFAARYVIGENADIKNNNSLGNTHTGLFYLNNGGEITIGGEIHHNNNKVVYMANQSGGQTYLRVVDGAYIHHNEGTTSHILGPKSVLFANNGGWIIVEGGVISDNTGVALYIRSKDDWPNAKLQMSGGKIVNNSSYGIRYTTSPKSKNGNSFVDISGGEIYGNKSSTQVTILGSNADDLTSRMYIAKGVIKEENNKIDGISTSFGTIYNIFEREAFYVGNAKSSASSKLSELVEKYKASDADLNDYKVKGSALWLKPGESTFEFTAKRSSSINVNLPLYVAYIPLNEDGSPKNVSQAEIVSVPNEVDVNIKLENLVQNQPYALMWMQPTEKFGYLALEGTPEISEKLGVMDYTIDYTATYTLSKDIAQLVKPGDEFEVEVKLDNRLTYDDSVEEYIAKIEGTSRALELYDTKYDSNNNTVTLTLKVKDGFTANSHSSYPAKVSFTTKASIGDFNAKDISADASVSGSVVLSGQTAKTNFNLDILEPWKTALKPLPVYTISYDDGTAEAGTLRGEAKVKEGTGLVLDLAGGTLNEPNPNEPVTEDIALPNPTRNGYTFKGWQPAYSKDGLTIEFTAKWRSNLLPIVNYYTLTIHYSYGDGTQARPDVVETLEEGSSYSVTSPTIDGYTASQSVVSGTLSDNAEFTVTYTENSEIDDPNVPLDPNPGKDDPSIDDPIIDDPDVPLSPGTDLPKDNQNGNQSNKNNTNQPKTGDHEPLMAWTGVLLLSAGLLIPVFARRRKDALK